MEVAIDLTEGEKERRYSAIRKEMARRSLDCLIITGYSSRFNEMNGNVQYVTNYGDFISTVSYVIFPLDAEPTFVVQMNKKRSHAALCWIKDFKPFGTADAANTFAEKLKANNLTQGTIGLVGASFREGEVIGMPYNTYQALEKKLPEAKLVDCTDMFTSMRMIKSEEEIRLIEKSAEICDIIFEDMLKAAKPGARECDWFADIHSAMIRNGGENPNFLIGASGPMPTADPLLFKNDPMYSSRIMRTGDVIISEVGPKVRGYMTQTLQMISLGSPNSELALVAEYSVDVFKRIEAELKPGRKISEILKSISEYISGLPSKLGENRQSLMPFFHSLGFGAPEPTLGPMADIEVKPGMVLIAEIGGLSRAHVYSWLGSGFVITSGGCRDLQKISSKERALSIV